MTLIVIGSREWTDSRLMFKVLNRVRLSAHRAGDDVSAVWSGGSRGADRLAASWARCCGIPLREWLPDWDLHGKRAGVARSRDMIDAAPLDALVVAFVPCTLSASRGTAYTCREAQRRRMRVLVYDAAGVSTVFSCGRGVVLP